MDKHFKKQQPKTINYLTSSDRLVSRFNYLHKDTSFYLAKSIKINMHEKYNLSIIKGNLSPVIAKSRGYAFTVDKVKKNSVTLSHQWIDLRNVYSNGFNYTFIKKYSYKKMNIEEYHFSFDGYQNVYGVSRLIEVGNDRYFINFANKRKSPNYDMLKRYLNYYLKIE